MKAKLLNEDGQRCALTLRKQTPIALEIYAPDAVTEALTQLFPEITATAVTRPESVVGGSGGGGGGTHIAGGQKPPPAAVVPIAIDDRVRRMVELAILSTPAVILVGPPGTGKTQLLREILQKIEADPAAFGFVSAELNAPKWTTPEESWTTRELVGGETVDEEQRLRFRPGHLLNAIEEGRWLVLDEANRADMDKIFGATPHVAFVGASGGVGRPRPSVDSRELSGCLAWMARRPREHR